KRSCSNKEIEALFSPGWLASRRLSRQQILKLGGREDFALVVGNGDLPAFTCPHACPCNRDQ
ncbi:MAG TPA: hypothetical protein VGJ68_01625, partial [Bradyrhizobium sp.]